SLDDTVIRMSTKTGKPVGDPIPVGRNPFAVAAHGSTAWVTNVAAASVTRIDAK
ncbi:MAG: serine/threonine protein kinase, partial [Conexibacter sp.]|nr:serine/threonine protein kinase [Conexibacter sp.]